MSFDPAAIRDDFPALAGGTAYFDGPGGTQTPRQVGAAMAAALTGPLSNLGSGGVSERNAAAAVQQFRAAAGDLLGADPRGVVFGRSATQLTFDFARHLAKTWRPDDEIVLSRLDHDANVRPWVLAAAASGVVVRWLDIDPASAELVAPQTVINERTRLVAVTAASNLLGTMPPVAEIAAAAHAVGALMYVDAVHYAAHAPVDLAGLGADLVVCSPYKFLGPHCAVLAADPALLERLEPDKLLPSTDEVPERFEFGTLPFEQLAGVTAAVDYLAGLDPSASGDRRARLLSSMSAVQAHEDRLRRRLDAQLAQLPGVTVWSRARRRTPTLLLTFADRPATAVQQALADTDVLAPAGSFYAVEAARRLGLDAAGGLRIGLSPYTVDTDVDRLLDALSDTLAAPPTAD